MKSFCKSACAALGLAALTVAAPSHGQVAYAIANGGDTLISFNVSSPGTVNTVGMFSGGNMFLDALDFRPATGQLYGYSDAADATYLVNTSTGALTLVGPSPNTSPTNTNLLGMDFNPTIDRYRVVTDSAQNIVINPANGAANAPATNLFYMPTDVSFTPGAAPLVVDNAYNNNIAGTGLGTVQYGIDYGVDRLVTIANNAGTLATVNPAGAGLGVDTDIYVGFDIFTDQITGNSAYALLTPVGGTAGLYSINLNTGAASLLGGLGGGFSQVYSLAITPTQVPEPGTIALFAGAALTAVPVLRRRRRR